MKSNEQGEYCRSGSAGIVIAIRLFHLEPLYKLSTYFFYFYSLKSLFFGSIFSLWRLGSSAANEWSESVDNSSLVVAVGNQYFLACIARRVNDMEQLPAVQSVEQFVTKQDLTGKILACDTRFEMHSVVLSSQFLMFFLVGIYFWTSKACRVKMCCVTLYCLKFSD